MSLLLLPSLQPNTAEWTATLLHRYVLEGTHLAQLTGVKKTRTRQRTMRERKCWHNSTWLKHWKEHNKASEWTHHPLHFGTFIDQLPWSIPLFLLPHHYGSRTREHIVSGLVFKPVNSGVHLSQLVSLFRLFISQPYKMKKYSSQIARVALSVYSVGYSMH